jgi:hypothetical protein
VRFIILTYLHIFDYIMPRYLSILLNYTDLTHPWNLWGTRGSREQLPD